MSKTIVTGADERYWRCLYQLLISVERHRVQSTASLIAYDLGLQPATLAILRKRFGWCDFRPFDFELYPAHVRLEAGAFAWKPVIVAGVMEETLGPVLWLDSATIIKQPLSPIFDIIEQIGTFTLKGQATLRERCDPLVIRALNLSGAILGENERVATLAGFDAGRPAVLDLARSWRSHALIKDHIRPDGLTIERHMNDQAVLSGLVLKAWHHGFIELNDHCVDISAPDPVPWLSTRNKVPPTLPVWADPLARAWYATYKLVDRNWIAFNRRRGR